jgi:pimeloyl-ACP methyl ester carboxylesterase
MNPSITGFDYQRVTVAEDVALHVAVGGSGSPIVLLHGFPQTHLMWRHVAADLAADHTVICPDLRGYGASDKPLGDAYAKRTMAADIVALARALGHDRFALAGHDRGALVAVRAGLDHPGVVTSSRAGARAGRPGSTARRRSDTNVWIAATAPRGGSSHRSSTRRSTGTTRPRATSRRASTARWREPLSATGPAPVVTDTGPSTPKATPVSLTHPSKQRTHSSLSRR